MVTSPDFRSEMPRFQSQPCHLLAESPWASLLTSLSLFYHLILTSQGRSKDQRSLTDKMLGKVLDNQHDTCFSHCLYLFPHSDPIAQVSCIFLLPSDYNLLKAKTTSGSLQWIRGPHRTGMGVELRWGSPCRLAHPVRGCMSFNVSEFQFSYHKKRSRRSHKTGVKIQYNNLCEIK